MRDDIKNTHTARAVLSQQTVSAQDIRAILDTQLALPENEVNLPLVRACYLALHPAFEKDGVPGEEDIARKVRDLLASAESVHSASDAKAKDTRDRPGFARRWLVRSLAAACAIMILAIGVQTGLNRQWLVGSQQPDEQQYTVEGKSVNPRVLPEGQAATESGYQRVRTTDFKEAHSILDFVPPLPQWLPDGWTLSEYYASSSGAMQSFAAVYGHPDTKYIIALDVDRFFDAESIRTSYEQNEAGETVQIGDKSVYMAANYETLFGVWSKGLDHYSVYGPVSRDELVRIIQSVSDIKDK